MRIIGAAALRLRDADEVQELDRSLERGAPIDLLMKADRLRDLVADAMHRVERGHRLLKDHRDLVAADVADLLLGNRQQVFDDAGLAPQPDLAADDRARRRRGEAHDGEAGDALARARFPDKRQRLALAEREGNLIDDEERAAAGGEADAQLLDGERRRVGYGERGTGALRANDRAGDRRHRAARRRGS